MARFVTCSAPVNIAVIKYWGKRDEELVLPLNDSLSITLSQDEMCTKTTVAIGNEFDEDAMWLNDKKVPMDSARLQNCIREIRKLALQKLKSRDASEDLREEMLSWPVCICSRNNFPTAAGLASSAAGFACLVFALAKLYGVDVDVSHIARQGSGSACRSMFGGFVHWVKGEAGDGLDSRSVRLFPHDHWPELRVLVLVVSDEAKSVGSTVGMERSFHTSELLHWRITQSVPGRISRMERAIRDRDFQTFAEITMQDSNQFHAVCLDTYPPICYLNDVSKAIMHAVHGFNAFHGKPKAAYTFDAGPNACLLTLEDDVSELLSLVVHCFPPGASRRDSFVTGMPCPDIKDVAVGLWEEIDMPPRPDGINHIIYTKIGDGPKVLPVSERLLTASGVPTDSA